MKKFLIFCLCIACLCVAQTTIAQEEVFSVADVAVIKIGEKISNATGNITITPLYLVRVGDTSVAEMEMALWQKVFGSYARNAIFYTRFENGNWKARGYRRPMNKEEAEKFFENPLFFYAEKVIYAAELPISLGKLSNELSQVSRVMEYLRGGVQIYPIDGTSLEEIITLAKKIFVLTRPKSDV